MGYLWNYGIFMGYFHNPHPPIPVLQFLLICILHRFSLRQGLQHCPMNGLADRKAIAWRTSRGSGGRMGRKPRILIILNKAD